MLTDTRLEDTILIPRSQTPVWDRTCLRPNVAVRSGAKPGFQTLFHGERLNQETRNQGKEVLRFRRQPLQMS